MGRCPFRATRPGGCRSGDHIHEAVTASPRTRPKRSPQGHGLLPNQQRTDALRPVSEPRSLRRLGSGRSRLQDDHRATTEAVGNALDSQPRQRNYCPSLFPAQWPLGRILGTTRRWLISDRKSTRLNSSHPSSSYAVFCLKKKKKKNKTDCRNISRYTACRYYSRVCSVSSRRFST